MFINDHGLTCESLTKAKAMEISFVCPTSKIKLCKHCGLTKSSIVELFKTFQDNMLHFSFTYEFTSVEYIFSLIFINKTPSYFQKWRDVSDFFPPSFLCSPNYNLYRGPGNKKAFQSVSSPVLGSFEDFVSGDARKIAIKCAINLCRVGFHIDKRGRREKNKPWGVHSRREIGCVI